MSLLKVFIPVVASIAIAVSPVAALLAPCCCAPQIKAIAHRGMNDAAETPACCAKHEAPASPQICEHPAPECGCVYVPPLAPQESKSQGIAASFGKSAVASSTFDAVVQPPYATHYLDHLPGLRVPAGPLLLALYCIWLK